MTQDTRRNILVLFVSVAVLFSFSSIAHPRWRQGITTMFTSWYGPGYHGRKTASTLVFNQYNRHMAAHRTLPFGSKLWVRNKKNGRATWVIVVDRGPYITGRSLDVSAAAAAVLGFRRRGLADLQVTYLGRAANYKAFFRGRGDVAMLEQNK